MPKKTLSPTYLTLVGKKEKKRKKRAGGPNGPFERGLSYSTIGIAGILRRPFKVIFTQ